MIITAPKKSYRKRIRFLFGQPIVTPILIIRNDEKRFCIEFGTTTTPFNPRKGRKIILPKKQQVKIKGSIEMINKNEKNNHLTNVTQMNMNLNRKTLWVNNANVTRLKRKKMRGNVKPPLILALD